MLAFYQMEMCISLRNFDQTIFEGVGKGTIKERPTMQYPKEKGQIRNNGTLKI
jgi:hypothetical protein